MLSNYFSIFQHSFNTLWWFHLFIILLFIIATSALIFMTSLCVLDISYRPNIPQYPYNLFFDRMCPIIFIISPTIIILNVNLENYSFIAKFFFLIIIHFFFAIPLMYLWSKNRNWPSYDIQYWSSPTVLFSVLIILTYILFFFFFVYLIRYLRLGMDVSFDFTYVKDFITDPFIFSLLCSPFVLGWFFIGMFKLIQFRYLLWYNVAALFYSLHIKFLKFYIYFRIMEVLYKVCFIWITFIINESFIYNKKPKTVLRFIIHYLYRKPFIINIFLFSFVFLELYVRNCHLYYSLFLVFYYIITKNIIYFINQFALSKWAFDCCIADYINYNYENPRYKNYFWFRFNTIHREFNFKYNTNMIEEQLAENKKYNTLYKKVHKKLLKQIIINPLIPFKQRLRISYYQWSSVRWMHRVTAVSRGFYHPLTGLFAETVGDKIILLNDNWHRAFSMIQKREKIFPQYITNNVDGIKDSENYPFVNVNAQYQKGFLTVSKLSELGAVSWFTEVVTKLKATASPFNKKSVLHTKSQSEPDVTIDLRNAVTNDQRVHGFDQKVSYNPVNSNSQILCGDVITKDHYESILQDNIKLIQLNLDLDASIMFTIIEIHENLGNFYDDFNMQLEYLLKNIHHFNSSMGLHRYIPSLITNKPIDIAGLHPEIKIGLEQRAIRLKVISDSLYEKKFTINDINKALDIFDESYIQKLMQNL